MQRRHDAAEAQSASARLHSHHQTSPRGEEGNGGHGSLDSSQVVEAQEAYGLPVSSTGAVSRAVLGNHVGLHA
jgi:hypothetical protein